MSESRDMGVLELVLATAPDAVLAIDPERFVVVAANERAAALYGYSRQEFEGLSVADLSGDPETSRQALHGRERSYPVRYHRKKDGTEFPVEILGSEIHLDGLAIRLAYVRDLTQRLRDQAALQASETKYSTAFKTSPDAININRLSDGLYLEINEGFTALTGYSEADVAGRTSMDIEIWADEADRQRLVAGLRECGSVRNFEALFRFKDGRTRWGLMSARVIEVGGEACILSVTRDITERREAQAAIEASEAKFSMAFRISPDAVCITAESDGRFIDVNDSFSVVSGYDRSDVIGTRLHATDLYANLSDRDVIVAALVENGAVDNFHAEFRRKDGTTFPGVLSARVVTIDGERCVYSVTRDVTERLEAERLLKETNQRLKHMVMDVAEAMGRIVESRDPYTQGHQERVSELSRLIAHEMGLEPDRVTAVEMAALVHDVGKLAVPAEILNKPGRLSAIEFSLIKVHSEQGYAILRDIDFGAPIARIVLQHHERIDGSGYPGGLVGDEISLEARILCVADVVEAMASYRPYRPAVGLRPALDEITTNSAKYDPSVVSACIALHSKGELAFLEQPVRPG